MVSTRKQRAPAAAEVGGATEENVQPSNQVPTSGDYEQFRDQRIKENKERMQKLGIFNLSLKLKAAKKKPAATKRTKGNVSKPTTDDDDDDDDDPFPLSASPRRSTRLKSLTPINYSEMNPKMKRERYIDLEIRLSEGSEPETYTEEDEKLLGDCKASWILCVDGYGEDGKRIYDQEKGETCHQCRQKTLGLHTHCSKCNLVQGQFCGDCLYMRYGENVLEANQNPNWICPVCRGICNCSLCRKVKGWVPTGSIYRRVVNLGFKSVAHFLIQTRRAKSLAEDLGAESFDLKETAQPSANESSLLPLSLEESPNASEHPASLCPSPNAQLNERGAGREEEEKQVERSECNKHVDINDHVIDCNDDDEKERRHTKAAQEFDDPTL